ncbi:MAG TPA: CBS domain-containing protein, partial [Chloroflexota bacterium]
MKVREVMSTPPISVSPDTDVRTIARLLVKNDVDGVPVVDAAGRVLGMVTESDLIIRNANLHFPRFLQIM